MKVELQQIILLLIVTIPLMGALINGLFGKRFSLRCVSLVGVGSAFLSFGCALVAFVLLYSVHQIDPYSASLTYDMYEWFSLTLGEMRTVSIHIGLYMDQLSGLMTLIITGIGSLIHLYSVGYMSEDPGYSRFFSYLNLFTASMLILVLGLNLPVMFIGWEGVGLCSYLLIGFWYENSEYAAAGRKAFVTNRIGDFGILLAMFMIVPVVGSLNFTTINDAAAGGAFRALFPVQFFGLQASVATVVCLFLFLGCVGKSAQIPLYVWLPDAMAGPTPVSALIHAATMVTAGVYLCARLSPLFITSDVAMAVIAVVGTLTALLAASIAVTQTEMKKILAYSTVSQLGFMFAAVGVGFYAAGFFHVFTHAFFKGSLFLGAGSVMHGVGAHGDANIFKLGGLKKRMPITRLTFLCSCLAIAGFPMTSGFFSKEEILLGAAGQIYRSDDWLLVSVGWFCLIGLAIAAVMTAFYIFRLYFLTFSGEYRSAEGTEAEYSYSPHPHESPATMLFPLLVLGVGALFVGLLGLPHVAPFIGLHLPNWWSFWIEPSIQSHPPSEELSTINLASSLGIAAMVLGIGGAWVLYRNKSQDTLQKVISHRLYDFFLSQCRVDALYERVLLNPIKKIAVYIGQIDITVVDTLLTRIPSFKVRQFGKLFAKAQNGVVHTYAMVLTLGVVVVLIWFWNPHARVEASAVGPLIELSSPAGIGYQYRWDANSNGRFESDWRSAPSFRYRYTKRDIKGAVVYMTNNRTRVADELLLNDVWQEIPLDSVDSSLSRDKALVLPQIRLKGDTVLVRAQGAQALSMFGQDGVFPIDYAHDYRLGSVQINARPVVEARVEVKNVFGNTKAVVREFSLPFPLADKFLHASSGMIGESAR